jgi:hypothetical protein
MTRRLPLLFALALAFVPVAANATILKAIDFDQKVKNAASIVVGRVVSQESRWDDAKQWILTYSTFEVEQTLKGFPAQRVTIVTPGGQVGDVAQDTIGVPKFREGEEHVLFIRNSHAGPTVLYLEQGVYKVIKDDRGEAMVKPAVSNAVLVDTQRGRAVPREEARSLRAFEDSVRESVRRHEATRMEMILKQKREQASLWNQLRRNKGLVLLAMIGVVLASWQFLRRS